MNKKYFPQQILMKSCCCELQLWNDTGQGPRQYRCSGCICTCWNSAMDAMHPSWKQPFIPSIMKSTKSTPSPRIYFTNAPVLGKPWLRPCWYTVENHTYCKLADFKEKESQGKKFIKTYRIKKIIRVFLYSFKSNSTASLVLPSIHR